MIDWAKMNYKYFNIFTQFIWINLLNFTVHWKVSTFFLKIPEVDQFLSYQFVRLMCRTDIYSITNKEIADRIDVVSRWNTYRL